DLHARWAGYRPAEINLTAATLLCFLPQLAIAALDAPTVVRAAMQETLAAGLLIMAAGQDCDLALAGTADPAPETVEASVAGKSGEELAIFAALGAHLAGASPRVVASCQQLGRALATGGQLASDCHDLFFAAWSRDLASGTRTLPIALHLGRLQGRERAIFLALLDQARTDAAAQAQVRARLREAGELRRCAFTVEVYCQRAQRTLAEAGLLEPARSQLQEMIAGISMCRRGAGER
ncbi:MAG TPA: polyprenyl synthetase family protein, partial [Chloroflexota bacterium]|nr:polyprenyl synthetase family protein [Chloroflexota bacterium]